MNPDSSVPEDDDSKLLPPLVASTSASLSPIEALQRRYSDQLSQEIEQLEAQKAQLQTEITALANVYSVLEGDVQSLQAAAEAKQAGTSAAATSVSTGPRLPGEPVVIDPPLPYPTEPTATDQPALQLPIPATSEQRRQRRIQRRMEIEAMSVSPRRGLVLSAIAIVFMSLQFCLVSALGQGGSGFGLTIDQLGLGFMPATALLWLRMLVTVPALVFLAPRLHANTWADLQDWIYHRNRLLMILIGSGVALFFSQVLAYQCIGLLGPAVGAALLFLYPLTAMPLQLLMGHRQVSPLGGLALVAIAMGAILLVKPFLELETTPSAPLWLGLLSSLAFGLYILLTNLSYRQQQCHPIPIGLIQFSTVAVLSSVVLLAKPIEPVSISWPSFALWGLLIGAFMLVVYLFNYASLRLIGVRTAMVAATVPVVTLLLSLGFTPRSPLAVIQWTGILLIAIGGAAIAQEKLTNAAKA